MVNESDLPQFANGPKAPSIFPAGQRIITNKEASPLLKAMSARMKAAPKSKPIKKAPMKGRRGKTRGIKADDKVHMGKENLPRSFF